MLHVIQEIVGEGNRKWQEEDVKKKEKEDDKTRQEDGRFGTELNAEFLFIIKCMLI